MFNESDTESFKQVQIYSMNLKPDEKKQPKTELCVMKIRFPYFFLMLFNCDCDSEHRLWRLLASCDAVELHLLFVFAEFYLTCLRWLQRYCFTESQKTLLFMLQTKLGYLKKTFCAWTTTFVPPPSTQKLITWPNKRGYIWWSKRLHRLSAFSGERTMWSWTLLYWTKKKSN